MKRFNVVLMGDFCANSTEDSIILSTVNWCKKKSSNEYWDNLWVISLQILVRMEIHYHYKVKSVTDDLERRCEADGDQMPFFVGIPHSIHTLNIWGIWHIFKNKGLLRERKNPSSIVSCSYIWPSVWFPIYLHAANFATPTCALPTIPYRTS